MQGCMNINQNDIEAHTEDVPVKMQRSMTSKKKIFTYHPNTVQKHRDR